MATPFLLADNLFDSVALHPSYKLSTSGASLTGTQPEFVADNFRDGTWWTVDAYDPAAGAWIAVSTFDATATADTLIFDRNSRLESRLTQLQTSPDGTAWTTVWSGTKPTALGSLPSDANGGLTTEGVWMITFPQHSAACWRVLVQATTGGNANPPVFTGIYLGKAQHPDPLTIQGKSGSFTYHKRSKPRSNTLSMAGVRVMGPSVVHTLLKLRMQTEHDEFSSIWEPALDAMVIKSAPWWIAFDVTTPDLFKRTRLMGRDGDMDLSVVDNLNNVSFNVDLEEVVPLIQ